MNKIAKYILKKINKYYKKYFKYYWFIHKKYRNGRELLDVQYSINEIINEFNELLIINKQLLDNKELYVKSFENISFIIKIYRLLIDDIIIKYICEGDCALFSQLVLKCNNKFCSNTSYSYDTVKEYLNVAKKNILTGENYVVVCDLCTYELKSGDVLLYSKDGFDYIELKKGTKNKEIIENILLDNDLSGLNGSDQKQANRIINQIRTHFELDMNYGRPMFDFNTMRFFEYNTLAKTFLKQLKKDISKLGRVKYREGIVDEGITYLVILNGTEKNNDSNLLMKLKEYEKKEYVVYAYNEFIFDSLVARPYQINWGKKLYRDLLVNKITILIRIDVIALFNHLKKRIPKLVCRKATSEDYEKRNLFIMKNRIMYFDTNSEPFYIGNYMLFRIAAYLYTLDDVVDHYYSSILKYCPDALN